MATHHDTKRGCPPIGQQGRAVRPERPVPADSSPSWQRELSGPAAIEWFSCGDCRHAAQRGVSQDFGVGASPPRPTRLVQTRCAVVILAIALGSLGGAARGDEPPAASQQQEPPAAAEAIDVDGSLSAISLADVAEGKARIVDLTYPLNARTPHWPGENYSGFQLRTIATLEKDGVLSKMFSTPEHLGTHLDAPNHFEPNQPSVEQLPPEQLIGPGVVIDVADAAARDADYTLSVDDLRRWEAEHGCIRERAIVLLRTGWGRYYARTERYQNRDATGKMHFPGFSAEAARWLVQRRDVRGLGIDTLSIDPGASDSFPVHHIINGAGRYGLENVARLEELPPRGFLLIVAPIKIETGSGGPTRIWAILAKRSSAP